VSNCEAAETFLTLKQGDQGLMILKIFSPKNWAKITALFAQTAANFCKNLTITLIFDTNGILFAKN
jgi:hypothetical protein